MKIDELAAAAGVPVRTVRYYLARGVLPAPEFRGPHTVYGPEYLARLRAIQKLQEDYLPLDAIAEAVAGRSVEELERLAREGVGRRVLGAPLPAAASWAGPGASLGGGEVREGALGHEDLVFPSDPLPVRAVRATRWRLAPGVELVVDEDAPLSARELAEQLVRGISKETQEPASKIEREAKPRRVGKRPSRRKR